MRVNSNSTGVRNNEQVRPIRTAVLTAAVAGALLIQGHAALATTDSYTGVDAGNWNTASNWTTTTSTHVVPVNGDTVTLGTPSGIFSANFNGGYTGPGLASLSIDAIVVNSFTLNQTTVTNMIAANETLGVTQFGAIYNQTAGNNTVTNTLSLGTAGAVQSEGTYLLSGTGNLIAGAELVGASGAVITGPSQINQSGGSNTISATLKVADGSGTAGLYTLSNAGTLTVGGAESIGTNGVGTFTQTGGSHVVGGSSFLYLASGLGIGGGNAIATYNLGNTTGTATLTAGYEAMGDNGTATFNQTGGTNTASSHLYLSTNGGSATYNLSNGSLATNLAEIGGSGNGTFTQTGGNVSIIQAINVSGIAPAVSSYSISNGNLTIGNPGVAGLLRVGYTGNGDFTQSGGNVSVVSTNSTPSTLSIAFSGGNSANYSLSGNGSLSTGQEQIGLGGNATFTQSNGTNTASANVTLGVNPASFGNYTLINGSLSVGNNLSGTLIVGGQGTGNFNQTGGSVSTYQLYLSISPGSGGTYTLSGNGSNLSVTTFEVIGASTSATFTQNAGTHTLGGDIQIGQAPGITGTYFFNGGVFNIAGNVGDGQSGVGSFKQTGGALTVNNGFYIGSAPGSSGTYNISNGTASIGTIYVGNSGPGIVNQNGGTISVGTLEIGSLTTSTNATGNYFQTAGNLTVTSIAYLGLGSAVSSYQLSGSGVLSVPNSPNTFNDMFISSNGTFTQSGGTVNGYVFNSGAFNFNSGTFNGTLENGANGIANFISFVFFGAGIKNHGIMNFLGGQVGTAVGQTFTNDGTINLSNSGQIFSNGPVINNGSILGTGSIGGTAGFTNNLIVTQGAGQLTFSASGGSGGINNGTFTLASGRSLNLLSTLTNAGTFAVNGALVSASGGTLANAAGGTVTGPGTVLSNFSNSGTVLPGTGTLNIANAWTNAGVVELSGLTSALTGGAITNTGTLQGVGTIGSAITNSSGTLEAIGGTLVVSGILTNSVGGTLTANSGNKLLVTSGLANNAGLINLNGGTFDNGNHALNNTGQISGYGTFRTGGLTNNANITFSGTNGSTTTINGSVTNNAGQTINIKFNPAIFTGAVTNNATATIKTTATTVTFVGAFTNNGTYTSDPSVNIFGNIINNGTMTGSTGDVYTISSGGSFTNTNTFNNGGTFNGNANVTNSGTFTQSGPQVWTAGTTFSNTGGTATFASDTGSISTAPLNVAITGGTVNLAATQHLNSLTITTGSAAITLGTTKTNALTLGGSSNNWTGNLNLGNNKLIVEATALTKAAALATLQNEAFYGMTNSTGITSTALSSNLALAVIDNGALATPFTVLGGVSVDTNSILVAPELLGDANIDGHVDLNDLNTILNNLGTPSGGWTRGGFDGQATIDLNDLNDVLNNLGSSYANNSAVVYAESLLQGSVTPTPEPTSLAVLAVAPLLLRRRSKTRQIK